MISSGCKVFRNFFEYSVILIQNIYSGFNSMINFFKIYQTSSECFSNCLASKTDTQNTFFCSKMANHFLCNSCLIRNTGSRRDQDLVIFCNTVKFYFIISVNIYWSSGKLLKNMNKIVCERVVIV